MINPQRCGQLLTLSAMLVLASACQSGPTAPDRPAAVRTAQPVSTVTSAQVQAPEPPTQLIDYRTTSQFGQYGLSIQRSSDLAKLRGAPWDFVEFVRQVASSDPLHCQGRWNDIGIAKVRTDGFASGTVNDCIASGYKAIWVRKNGTWREELAGQDNWSCGDLARHHIPADIIDEQCYDGAGQHLLDYLGP